MCKQNFYKAPREWDSNGMIPVLMQEAGNNRTNQNQNSWDSNAG